MTTLKITVTMKKGVEDSEGIAVMKALGLLGYNRVQDVRTGKIYFVTMKDGSKKLGKEFCEKLLSNPVINECVVDEE